jgi:DNA modification methylase
MRKDGLVAGALSFDAMNEDLRQFVCNEVERITNGWFIAFCQAEAVSYWRDCIETAGMKYKAPMIWVKPDGMPQFNGQGPGMGYESMTAGWSGTGHSKWNGGGRHGVFIIPKGESERNVHETQKPVRLMSELVRLFTNVGETVLDPFMGSASTGVACVKLQRKFIGIELEERYFEASCKRIEEAYRQPDLFIEPTAKPIQEKLI